MVQYYSEKGKYGVKVTGKSRTKWFKTKKEGLNYVTKWSQTPIKKQYKARKKVKKAVLSSENIFLDAFL